MARHKYIIIVLLFTVLMTVSCGDQNQNGIQKDPEKPYTTVEIQDHDVVRFNNEALDILVFGQYYWGVLLQPGYGMSTILAKLSQMCEDELGFGITFTKCWDPINRNSYATAIESGQSFDLVFPNKYVDIQMRTMANDFWGRQYLDDEIYMDISPYLAQFCPEAIVRFERYPQIKSMCTIEDKTYAIYAGMPDVCAPAIFVKNEILEQNNMEYIKDFDTLYDLMQNMYVDVRDMEDTDKVLLHHGGNLLDLFMRDTGYYPLYGDYLSNINDVVLRQDDDRCRPYLIEETDLLDQFYEMFSRFFENSYFTFTAMNTYLPLDDMKSQNFYISTEPLRQIYHFSRYITDDKDNVFNRYSVFPFESEKVFLRSVDSVLFVMVPRTCKDPKKSLHFMQWLMTDEDAADVLTFGTQHGSVKHYRYSEEGTVIPEENNSIYGFYNLVANFSKKAFLCGNKDFDISESYRKLTIRAIIPPFYEMLISQHTYLDQIQKFYGQYMYHLGERENYIVEAINEWMENPDSVLTPDDIKDGLSKIPNNEALLDSCKKMIQTIFESGEPMLMP